MGIKQSLGKYVGSLSCSYAQVHVTVGKHYCNTGTPFTCNNPVVMARIDCLLLVGSHACAWTTCNIHMGDGPNSWFSLVLVGLYS